jgi:hypothetical protein
VNGDSHGTGIGRVGNDLAPDNFIPDIYNRFVWRAKMLVYGNYNLRNKRRFNRFPFGSMLARIEFKAALKTVYRHLAPPPL